MVYTSRRLIFPLLILVVCALSFIPPHLENPVSAQLPVCPGPPFYGEVTNDGYSPGDQFRFSWNPGPRVITVKIDEDWGEAHYNFIKAGVETWNDVASQTCSGVTFGNFGTMAFPNKDAIPNYNSYTIYITKRPGAFADAVTSSNPSFNRVDGARIRLAASFAANQALANHVAHEIGHTFGINNCSGDGCSTDSIMGPSTSTLTGPTYCDINKIRLIYCPSPSPTPTPTPIPPPTPGDELPLCEPPDTSGEFMYCPTFGTAYDPVSGLCCPGGGGCPIGGLSPACENRVINYCGCVDSGNYWDNRICDCQPMSPIIVDIDGDGIQLTSGTNGVDFDLTSDGVTERLSWTEIGGDDAWLTLDRNGNGTVDNGAELFGNYSPQPPLEVGEEKNGFRALAEYDKWANGGNSDGLITAKDAIFAHLRLWQDVNHNGKSETSELFTLPQLGLRKMHLDYRESNQTDAFGNRFKYKAKVKDAQGTQLGRWAWDVFLVKDLTASR